MGRRMIVAIEGSIGSGKTTTVRLLAQLLGWDTAFEQTHLHSFVDDFYADMERFKLETELQFLLLHYHQFHLIGSESDLLTDFSPGKDLIFARLNLDGQDLDLFEIVYRRLSGRLDPPRLTIVLDAPLPVLKTRVQERGRPHELNLPEDYLDRLHHMYHTEWRVLGPDVRFMRVSPEETDREVAARAAQLIREALL